MIDIFKSELIRFIYMGGIKFPEPSIITITNDDRGSTQNFPIISLAPTYSIGAFLKHIMVHSLLDAVFESENPDLENRGYVQKYQALPEENNYEMAVKETYRILTMVRNVITHNKSKLAFTGDRLVCSYDKVVRNKPAIPLSLNISLGGLEVLYATAVLRSKLKGEVDRYHQLMITAMYNTAVASVTDFQDEYRHSKGIGLRHASVVRQIRWNRRYRVMSPEYEDQGDTVRFTKFMVPEPESGWAGDEYLFNENGSYYIIPGEFLKDDGSINKKELSSWKMINRIIFSRGVYELE